MLKKSFFIVVACSVAVSLNAAKDTHKLQILLDPANITFYMNDGNGIITDQSATRPAGAYFVANGGLILPAKTVHRKHQTSYLVDHHGNTITESDAIGHSHFVETMLQTLNFASFPAEGTKIELSDWVLTFKKDCYHDERNTIIGKGYAEAGILGFGSKIFTYILAMTGGTGCNDHDNTMVAKAYLAPDGQSVLVKIKFDKEIKYND